MSRRPKLPALPAPPADASPQQRSFFQAIKQQLDALVGQLGERDRAVTFRDLEDGGLARLRADGYIILPGQEGPEGPPGPQGDPGENGTGLPTVAAGVIPPAVTGLKATAAYSSIILTWNDPDWPAGASTFNVAYFEIFRATSATPNPPVPNASYSFGQTRALVFSDLAGTSKTYYYWVRIVGKNNEIGPVVGPVSATTSPNVPQLLDVLTGQLSESQLVASLNDRIDLVDDSGTLATSVTARIAAEAAARDAAISARETIIRTDFASADDGVYADAQAYVQGYAYSIAQADAAIAGRESIIRTDFAAADSSTLASAQTYVQNWAYAKSTVYTKTEADSAITTQVNTVNARLNTGGDTYNSIVQAQTLASSKNATFVQSTAPTATKLNDLWIHTGDQNKVYRWNGSAWVVADDQRIGATASQVTTLQSSLTTLDGEVSDVQTDVASLQISASTSASKITGLEAQYTVKTDVNGRVAGFGLASYGPTDTSPASGYSEFAVVADKFSIAPVATSPAADSHPFFHLTAPTVIDGVTVPAGTYMKQAYIHNAAINTAQIKDAAVDTAKIADAAIVEAKIGDLQVTTAKIDDAAITTAKIGAAQITTALIEDAAITDAKIGLAEITGAKIANATITDANIGSLNAGKITAGTLSADRIAAGSITGGKIAASTILAGNIAGGQITADKMAANSITAANGAIANLAVTTFKIGDNAVTVPVANTGGAFLLSGAYATATSVGATMTGQRVFVQATARLARIGSTSVPAIVRARLLLNSTEMVVVESTVPRSDDGGGKVALSFGASAFSVNGGQTFYLQLMVISGTNVQCDGSTLFALEAKK